MKYQSMYVLALFLGTSQAIKMRSLEDPKKPGDSKSEKPGLPPEKVHNLLPTHTQDLSNNMDPEYPTFPQPVGIGAGRTAFYAQRDNMRMSQHHSYNKDIGDKKIDEGVWGFSTKDKNVLPEPRPRQNIPYPDNGEFNPSWQWVDKVEPKILAQKHHHRRQSNKDIGDKKIDEGVWGFASNDKNVLPEPRPRQNIPYPENGVFNESWKWLDKPGQETKKLAQKRHHHHHHHSKKDIGEKNIDERVWGFASNDKNVLPTPRPRQNIPYPENGVFNPSWQWVDQPEKETKGLVQKRHHHHQHHSKKDIGDKKIDEGVWGFATKDKNVLPEPRPRQNIPYPDNGEFNPSWKWVDQPAEKKSGLAQQGDIGDRKIEEHVHGFTAADRNVLPMPRKRQNVAYPDNGVFNPSWKWVDEPSNGQGLAQHDSQEMDIGNSKYVRPDVFQVVDENIGQIHAPRTNEAPDDKFQPSQSGQGIEIIASGPDALKK